MSDVAGEMRELLTEGTSLTSAHTTIPRSFKFMLREIGLAAGTTKSPHRAVQSFLSDLGILLKGVPGGEEAAAHIAKADAIIGKEGRNAE